MVVRMDCGFVEFGALLRCSRTRGRSSCQAWPSSGPSARTWRRRGGNVKVMLTSAAVEEAVVQHARSHAIEVKRIGSLGDVAGRRELEKGALSAVHVVVGRDEKGEDWVSFATEKPRKGQRVPVQSAFSVKKPSGVSCADATTLALLALNVVGALESGGFGSQDDMKNKKLVVIGGIDGGASSFAVQLLAAWGAEVFSVTTSNTYKTMALGAAKVLDPRRKSFSETLPEFDAVVDGLGDESGSSITTILRRSPYRARYIPIVSPLLLRACRDGLIRGGVAVASMARNEVPADCVVPFVPSESGLRAVELALSMAQSGEVSHIPSSVVTSSELFEALRWPRDAETGARFGFPAPDLFDTAASEDEDVSISGTTSPLFRNAEELLLQSEEQLRDVIKLTASEEDPTETAVMFIGASWCRRCKELVPAYKTLAESVGADRPEIKFLLMNAGELQGVAKGLEIKDVPEIVVFRGGKRIPARLNTTTVNLMELSIMKVL